MVDARRGADADRVVAVDVGTIAERDGAVAPGTGCAVVVVDESALANGDAGADVVEERSFANHDAAGTLGRGTGTDGDRIGAAGLYGGVGADGHTIGGAVGNAGAATDRNGAVGIAANNRAWPERRGAGTSGRQYQLAGSRVVSSAATQGRGNALA
ncbi:hypothetical protein D9M71_355130 [compost metagenome]